MNKNIALYLIFVIFLFSCSGKKDTDKLIIGVNSSLLLGNNNPVFIQRNANVWETLTLIDDNYEPKPCIAKKWESFENGKLWVLEIYNNIKYHNGEILKPEHIVANINRFKEHPELDFYSVYTFLDTAYVKDNKIFIKFSKSSIDYPKKVGHYFAGIFHPKSFDNSGRISNLLATGPYSLKEYKIGKYELVEYFDDYRDFKPKYQKVEFRIIIDPTIRLLALIKGDIDIIAHHGGVQSYQIEFLKKYPFIRIDSFKLGITHYLIFNYKSQFFKSYKNRLALNNGINRYELVNKILMNKGYPADDFFIPENKPWSKKRFNLLNSNLVSFFNPKVDREINIVINQSDISNWGYKLTAEYLYSILKKYSISSRIKIVEPGTYKKLISNGDFDITLYPLSIPTGTPELFLRNLIYSKGLSVKNSSNLSHIKDKEIDLMIESAIYAENEIKQNNLFNEILNKIADSCFILPLYHEKYYLAYNQKVSKLHLDPFLKLDLNKIK